MPRGFTSKNNPKIAKAIDFDYNEVTGCWVINSHYKNKKGYSRINFISHNTLIHRFVYESFYGELTSEQHVLHHCDNPSCINIEHLFVGTNKDNIDDKVRKGRQVRGEKLGLTRYTEAIIKEIRDKDLSVGECHRRWGMHKTNVYAIKKRKTWKHI